MIKKLYKTSEFAELCGVKKHTLYHYDEIELLKPSITHENGYRYYTIDQFEKFNIMDLLIFFLVHLFSLPVSALIFIFSYCLHSLG
ncbi:MerR family DNA-binding transcriptional regulator [Clostridioides difficile]|uniref:MerR family DNA-binding transcriptional regulator n=1 Tax=Clostridioides difficile TaxID=1496 RepID=UPI0021D28EE3|nr:MerR family DNA-binding transcriptional regulator [Clostridioides difficile]